MASMVPWMKNLSDISLKTEHKSFIDKKATPQNILSPKLVTKSEHNPVNTTSIKEIFEFLSHRARMNYDAYPDSFKELICKDHPHLLLYCFVHDDRIDSSKLKGQRSLSVTQTLLRGETQNMCANCFNSFTTVFYAKNHQK